MTDLIKIAKQSELFATNTLHKVGAYDIYNKMSLHYTNNPANMFIKGVIYSSMLSYGMTELEAVVCPLTFPNYLGKAMAKHVNDEERREWAYGMARYNKEIHKFIDLHIINNLYEALTHVGAFKDYIAESYRFHDEPSHKYNTFNERKDLATARLMNYLKNAGVTSTRRLISSFPISQVSFHWLGSKKGTDYWNKKSVELTLYHDAKKELYNEDQLAMMENYIYSFGSKKDFL